MPVQVTMDDKTKTEGNNPRSGDGSVGKPRSDEIVVGRADVLLGRGKGVYEWRGNIEYQQIIARYLRDYMMANENKTQESRIVHNIVAAVKKSGGRFLKRESRSNGLVEVTDGEARTKVSHALRHQRRRARMESAFPEMELLLGTHSVAGPKLDFSPDMFGGPAPNSTVVEAEPPTPLAAAQDERRVDEARVSVDLADDDGDVESISEFAIEVASLLK